MSGVVAFADFGVDDLSLYRYYLDVNKQLSSVVAGDGRVSVVACHSCTLREGGDIASGRRSGVAGGRYLASAGRAAGGLGGQKRFAHLGAAAGVVAQGRLGSSWSSGVRFGGRGGSVLDAASVGSGRNSDVAGASASGVLGAAVGSSVCVESAGDSAAVAAPGSVHGDGDLKAERGPNWERNRASRDRKKRQRQMRGVHCASLSGGAGCSGLGSIEHGASVSGAGSGLKSSVVPDLVRDNQEGFWNSCSVSVRQRLVDSKAEMHIAENERRAREAKEKVAYLDSPEAMLRKAMSMVGMAEKCAKQKNDSKVAGWAETVATSYAESIAKSAPSSVPSYASVLSGSSATSVSVDGTKRKKPQALGLPRKSYGGDPQNPSYTYYEKRIGCTNNPIGLEKILDELQENKALADIDRTVLLSKCYDKKQRHGGVEVFA